MIRPVSQKLFLQWLISKSTEIKHGKIRIGFNPDEEIGEGALNSMWRNSVVNGPIRWTAVK